MPGTRRSQSGVHATASGGRTASADPFDREVTAPRAGLTDQGSEVFSVHLAPGYHAAVAVGVLLEAGNDLVLQPLIQSVRGQLAAGVGYTVGAVARLPAFRSVHAQMRMRPSWISRVSPSTLRGAP